MRLRRSTRTRCPGLPKKGFIAGGLVSRVQGLGSVQSTELLMKCVLDAEHGEAG